MMEVKPDASAHEMPNSSAQNAKAVAVPVAQTRFPWEASSAQYTTSTFWYRCVQSMSLSSPRYITTRRTTNCDIESVITTTRLLLDHKREEENNDLKKTAVPGTTKLESNQNENKSKSKRAKRSKHKTGDKTQIISTTTTRINSPTNVTRKNSISSGSNNTKPSISERFTNDIHLQLPDLKKDTTKKQNKKQNNHRPNTKNIKPRHMRKTNTLHVKKKMSVQQLRAVLIAEKTTFLDSLARRREERMSIEASATVTIQTSVRGFLSRLWMLHNLDMLLAGEHVENSRKRMDKQILNKRQERELLDKLADQMRIASTTIQKQVRSYQARRSVANIKNVATSILHINSQVVIAMSFRLHRARRHVALLMRRKEASIEQSACALVQAQVRKLYANRAVKVRRFAMQSVASGMIQRAAKMCLTRKAVKQRQIIRDELRRNSAALMIQCMTRQVFSSALAQRRRLLFEYRLRHAAALYIQCNIRSFYARRVRQLIEYTRRDVLCEISALRLQGWARLNIIAKRRVNARKIEVSRDLFFQTRANNISAVETLFHDGSCRYNSKSTDRNGNTILLTACKHGHIEIAKKCINDWGMALDVLNNKQESSLHLTLEGGFGELAQMLINECAGRLDFTRPRLLHFAASRGLAAVVPLLLSNNIRIDNEDPATGQTVMHWTVTAAKELTELRCNRMILLLHRLGASLDSVDNCGSTCLHFACAQGLETVTQSLLQLGASSALKNGRDETPWATCLRYGHTDCAKIVADHK